MGVPDPFLSQREGAAVLAGALSWAPELRGRPAGSSSDLQTPQKPQPGGGELPLPGPQVSAAERVRVGQFHFDFWLFPLLPFFSQNNPYSHSLREESQGQLARDSWSQGFYGRTLYLQTVSAGKSARLLG